MENKEYNNSDMKFNILLDLYEKQSNICNAKINKEIEKAYIATYALMNKLHKDGVITFDEFDDFESSLQYFRYDLELFISQCDNIQFLFFNNKAVQNEKH